MDEALGTLWAGRGQEESVAPGDRRGVARPRNFGPPKDVRALPVPMKGQAASAGPALAAGAAEARPVLLRPGAREHDRQGGTRIARLARQRASRLGLLAAIEGGLGLVPLEGLAHEGQEIIADLDSPLVGLPQSGFSQH